MQPHQERVVTERSELAEKLDKLNSFTRSKIFDALDTREQNRLIRQAVVMGQYVEVLDERIAAFPRE